MLQSLRNELKTKRKAISSEQQIQHAKNVAFHFISHNLLSTHQHIAGYVSVNGELDPSDIRNYIWQENRHFYLPFIDTASPNTLLFIKYQANDHLQPNQYGIPQPIYDAKKILPAALLDLVLTPLVGFDLLGNRLGMGVGFYDRTFAFMQNSQLQKPCLIGLAHECQQVMQLAKQPWDVPLHGIITENNYYKIKNEA